MKKIATLISIGTLFFYGCAGSSYSISTSGKENTNVAFIKFSDTCLYQIDDIIKYETSNTLDDTLNAKTTKVTIISKSTCNTITHINGKIIKSNMWYITSSMDNLLASKQNCQLESSINGINFLKCSGLYAIISEETKGQGYDNKNTIYTSKECYEALKNTISSCQNSTKSYTNTNGQQKNESSPLMEVKKESSVLSEKMLNLKKLYDDGLITKDEYIEKKEQLLKAY
jgi:hypothetical protein